MPVKLAALPDLPGLPFDELIDVRSPAEFAEDAVPGAVNLPVLSNEERAEVGTIYVQDDRFRARKIGAALVARNAARHLEGYLADKPGGYRPLVYCWRGGQRSGSFTSILKQIGWRADTIEGGYRAYRRLVVRALYDDPFPAQVLLIDGNTGTAKTEILNLLPQEGWQVIDLEGLARHRGSALGAMDGGQPTQKGFESALAMRVAALDPARPVVIEAESAKVGLRAIPPSLWAAMRAAPRLVLEAPIAARARHLARAYADVTSDPSELLTRLQSLHRMHGWEAVHRWKGMVADRTWEALAADLMSVHYDPRYRKLREGRDASTVGLEDLSPAALPDVARKVSGALNDLRSA